MKPDLKPTPPRLAQKLLEWFCSYDFLQTALWDLGETFEKDLEKKDKRRAVLRYWKDTLSILFHLCFKGKSHYSSNRIAMFKNNFVISIRNFRKDRAYSLMNILGLTAGLSAFILISMFVSHELSYDRFHDDYESIHRMSHERNVPMGSFEFTRVSMSIGPMAKERIPEVEAYTRLGTKGQVIVKAGDKVFYESNGYYVEKSFFDFFNFPVLAGDVESALSDPGAIIITESLANKYFGDANPLGEVLILNKNDPKRVAAIVKDPPANTQLQFQFLISLVPLEKRSNAAFSQTPCITYLKIKPSDYATVVAKIDDLKNNHFPANYGDARSKKWNLKPSVFNLQPIAQIHLESRIDTEASETGDLRYMYIFSAIGLVILIIACVNYTNAAVARSINRTKEVGVRKAIGATKGALVRLYLAETFLYVVISLVLSLIVISGLLPGFNQFLDKQLSFSGLSPAFVLLIAGIVLVITFLSGFYPALFLSRFSTVNALKGKSPRGRGRLLKKGLITFQFLIAQILIIVTIIIQSQLNFLLNKDIGYDREQLIYIPAKGELNEQYAAFKNDINAIPSVTSSSYVSNLLNNGDMTAYPINHFEGLEDRSDEQFWANFYRVGENFIATMGMEIVEGTDFQSDGQKGFIINEQLSRELGWDDPVGKIVKPQKGGPAHLTGNPIVGIVRDFNDQSLKSEIKPMMMVISPDSIIPSYLVARLSPQDITRTISSIETVWERYVDDRPFDFTFYDDKFNKEYNTEMRLGKMLSVFAAMAIGISVLGILGLSAFMVEERMKEFSIRKVLGATIHQLTFIVNKGFILPILMSFALAAPLAYYWAVDSWLQSFAYRIEVGPWVFAVAVFGSLLLTFLTISYHAVKLKRANPTKYLVSD